MDPSFWFDTINFVMVHCVYIGMSGDSGHIYQKYCICLKIYFSLTNSVDPDEMQHDAAFHLGLRCL